MKNEVYSEELVSADIVLLLSENKLPIKKKSE